MPVEGTVSLYFPIFTVNDKVDTEQTDWAGGGEGHHEAHLKCVPETVSEMTALKRKQLLITHFLCRE